MSIEKLAEKLHLPSDLVEAVKAETTPENFDELVSNYQSGRLDYFKASQEYKDALKQIEEKGYKGGTLKHIKTLNRTFNLGLTNTQMEEYKDFDSFLTLLQSNLSEQQAKLTADPELRKEVETYKTKYTEALSEKDRLEREINGIREKADNELKTAVQMFKAKEYFKNMVQNDKELPGIEGQDWTLKQIEKEIFSNYAVDSEGNIANLDGSQAVHPEKQIVMRHVSEIYGYLKAQANLVKRSNAGTSLTTVTVGGKPIVQASTINPAIQEKLKQLQNARVR